MVSRPLEDVLANLVSVEPAVGNKRKNPFALENEEVIKSSPKRLRSNEPDSSVLENATTTHLSQEEPGAINGHHAASKIYNGKVNGYHSDCPVVETTEWDLHQDVQEGKPKEVACIKSLASPETSVGHLQSSSEALLTSDEGEPVLSPHRGTSEAEDQSIFPVSTIYSTEIKTSPQHNDQTGKTEQKSSTADITTFADILPVKSEDLSPTSITESEELVSALSQPFWRNSDNLCWLDTLLVALVNCKSLKTSKPKDEPQHSSVWQLMRGYEDALSTIEVYQQTDRGKLNRLYRSECHVKNVRFFGVLHML